MYSLELFFVASNLDRDWLTIHCRTRYIAEHQIQTQKHCFRSSVLLFSLRARGRMGLRPIAQIRLCLACASQEVLFYVAIHPFSELRQNCCHQSHHDFDTFVLLYGFPWPVKCDQAVKDRAAGWTVKLSMEKFKDNMTKLQRLRNIQLTSFTDTDDVYMHIGVFKQQIPVDFTYADKIQRGCNQDLSSDPGGLRPGREESRHLNQSAQRLASLSHSEYLVDMTEAKRLYKWQRILRQLFLGVAIARLSLIK